MGDSAVVESWHLPRALSDEALRLLTSLPLGEIERRLRVPMAADGEAAIAAGQPVTLPSGTVIADPAWFESLIAIRAADRLELERQALRPIPVSERLPGPDYCDAEGRCWWGDAGDDQFVPSWRLCEQPDDTHFTHWLPAYALPLPEVK